MKSQILLVALVVLASCTNTKDTPSVEVPTEPVAVRSTPDPVETPIPPALELDQSTPRSVVALVLRAAKTGDFSLMRNLCSAGADADVMKLCNMANASPMDQKAFTAQFERGAVIEDATIDGDKAELRFLFGANGMQEETMSLVLQSELWYLQSY